MILQPLQVIGSAYALKYKDNTGYVLRAWEMATARYVPQAVINRMEQEFYDAIKGILPGLLYAVGGIVATTLIGAGLGGPPGAALGFAVGVAIVRSMGLGFLVLEIAEKLDEVSTHLVNGTVIAWESGGNTDRLNEAAKELAEGVAILFSAIMIGLIGFIAQRGLGAAAQRLSESKMGPKFAKWFTDRLSLNGYLKAIDKQPGEYVFTKDAMGRDVSAEGWLLKGLGKHDRKVHQDVTKGQTDIDAAHLIPNTYSGDSIPSNLVAAHRRLNRSYFKLPEGEIDRLYQQHPEKVYLKVTKVFRDNKSQDPHLVVHEAFVFEEGKMVKKFEVQTPIENAPSKPMGDVQTWQADDPSGKIKQKDWFKPGGEGTQGTKH